MTRDGIVLSIRQQLWQNRPATVEQTAALLEIIDRLDDQARRDQAVVTQAQIDRRTYSALVAAYDALIAEQSREASERKRADQARRESEERFRILFEHSPDSILVIDPHDPSGCWPIVDCNAVACRMNGYRREELLGQGIDLLHPEPADPEERAEYLTRLRAEGTIHKEALHCRKDGSFFPVEISSSLITLNGRELVLGIDRDISERRRAEQAQRFLVDASAILQDSLDYHTTFQSVARLAVGSLADWCAVAVVEDDTTPRLVAVAHADDRRAGKGTIPRGSPFDPSVVAAMACTIAGGAPVLLADLAAAAETAACCPDFVATLHQLRMRSAMIVPFGARGRVLGAFACVAAESRRGYDGADLQLATELAHRAALAVDNARLYREAKEALDARDEFLAVAAHELKRPLTTIFGCTRLLQQWSSRDDLTTDRSLSVLALAGGAAQNLERLIDSLIDFSRIQSGYFNVEREPVELCGLVRMVVAETQTGPAHQMCLHCCEEALIVEGDHTRLELVLHNLLQNAIKYSPAGGTITIRLTRRNGKAMVSVSDQGIGIPETARGRLFQRFYRASNADQAQISGTGIGLYLVNEIVTRHGGQVDVTSTAGAGSTFTVRLPLRKPKAARMAGRLEPQRAQRETV